MSSLYKKQKNSRFYKYKINKKVYINLTTPYEELLQIPQLLLVWVYYIMEIY